MKFIIFYLSISLSMIFIFYTGEYIAEKRPNSRFSKWWRRNIVMVDPYEKDDI